jgi:hypothetical protein
MHLLESSLESYISDSTKHSSHLANKSTIWKGLFKLRSGKVYSKLVDPNTFLIDKIDNASGTAGTDRANAIRWQNDTFVAYAQSLIKLSGYSFDVEPPCIKSSTTILSKNTNPAYVWNFLNYILAKHFLGGNINDIRGGHFLEIGPGYGCAANLYINELSPKSYTLVDLCENLANSISYLSSVQPDAEFNFVRGSQEVKFSHPSGKLVINVISAQFFEKISLNRVFNFVINSDSLGEMPAATAKAYLAKIAQTLSPNGLFVSINGHRRGSINLEGLERFSDYGYNTSFDLVRFGYKPQFSSPVDDFGHIAICRAKSHEPHSKTVPIFYYDVVSDLITLGLHDDLDEIVTSLNRGHISDEEKKFLNSAYSLMNGVDCSYCGHYFALFTYIRCFRILFSPNRACSDTVSKEVLNSFRLLLPSIKSCIPQYYYNLASSIYGAGVELVPEDPEAFSLAYSLTELSFILKAPSINQWVFKRIRSRQLSKKFFPYSNYSPSNLQRLYEFISCAIR